MCRESPARNVLPSSERLVLPGSSAMSRCAGDRASRPRRAICRNCTLHSHNTPTLKNHTPPRIRPPDKVYRLQAWRHRKTTDNLPLATRRKRRMFRQSRSQGSNPPEAFLTTSAVTCRGQRPGPHSPTPSESTSSPQTSISTCKTFRVLSLSKRRIQHSKHARYV